jgi:hypothetical protein
MKVIEIFVLTQEKGSKDFSHNYKAKACRVTFSRIIKE